MAIGTAHEGSTAYYALLDEAFGLARRPSRNVRWTPEGHRRFVASLNRWNQDQGACPEGDFAAPVNIDANVLAGPTPDFDFEAASKLQAMLWDKTFHMDVFAGRLAKVPENPSSQEQAHLQRYLTTQLEIRPLVEVGLIRILPHVRAWPSYNQHDVLETAEKEFLRRKAQGAPWPLHCYEWVASAQHATGATQAQFWTSHPAVWDIYLHWGRDQGNRTGGPGDDASGGPPAPTPAGAAGHSEDPPGERLLFDALAALDRREALAFVLDASPTAVIDKRDEVRGLRRAVHEYRDAVAFEIRKDEQLGAAERVDQLTEIAQRRMGEQLDAFRSHRRQRNFAHAMAATPLLSSLLVAIPFAPTITGTAVGIGAGVAGYWSYRTARTRSSSSVGDNIFWHLSKLAS